MQRHGDAAGANSENFALARMAIPQIFNNFSPGKIYDMDETGVCYLQVPATILSSQNASGCRLLRIEQP